MNMSDKRKFQLGKEPYIRKADGKNFATSVFMKDFMIALAPLILFAWVKNGLLPFINGAPNATFWTMIYPLLLVFVGGATSVIVEVIYYKIIKEQNLKERLSKSYAAIPGVLLGMIVTATTPIWLLIIGCVFATLIGKMLFGGFGHNIFNPALIGYLFITTAYIGIMQGASGIGYFNPSEAAEFVGGATPLTEFANNGGNIGLIFEKYSLTNMFLGFMPGSMAETSALLCLISLVYLLVRRVINWRIPIIYLGTVFVLTYIIGALNGYATSLDFSLFGLFTGGLMFGAVFMATEPVTSPRNPNGKIIYALGIGVLTVLIRFKANAPEGVAISILVMNLFTAIIERVSARLRVDNNKRKVLITYTLIGLLFLGISSYPVLSYSTTEIVRESMSVSSKSQDYATLDFVYTIDVNGKEVIVTTNKSYAILNISDNDFNNANSKTQFSDLIAKNKINDYIDRVEETLDSLTVYVITKGYSGNINSIVGYNENNVMISFTTDISNESYDEEYYGGWNIANGDPELLPGKIIENQNDLDQIESITGATRTRDAVVLAAAIANDYLEYLLAIDTLTVVNKYQSYPSLNFVYIFRTDQQKIMVLVNTQYEIISAVDASIEAEIQSIVDNNKLINYIQSVSGNTLIVLTKGYNSVVPITSTITFNNYAITGITSDTSEESYEYGSWNSSDGSPKQVMPARIIEGQNDIDNVEVISGATITAKAIIEAAKMALAYLESTKGGQ